MPTPPLFVSVVRNVWLRRESSRQEQVMRPIGENIARLDAILHAQVLPFVLDSIRQWQLEAESLVNVAHLAIEQNDLVRLRQLDDQAMRLLRRRREFCRMN